MPNCARTRRNSPACKPLTTSLSKSLGTFKLKALQTGSSSRRTVEIVYFVLTISSKSIVSVTCPSFGSFPSLLCFRRWLEIIFWPSFDHVWPYYNPHELWIISDDHNLVIWICSKSPVLLSKRISREILLRPVISWRARLQRRDSIEETTPGECSEIVFSERVPRNCFYDFWNANFASPNVPFASGETTKQFRQSNALHVSEL